MSPTLKKVLRTSLKVLAGIIILLVLLVLSLNFAFVQNFIKNRVISYLKEKTDTEIRLDRLRIKFPRTLELEGFYIEDKKKDTLLYANELSVALDMWKLIRSKIELDNIELHTVRAKVYRNNPDTVFNYQFLVDSLMSDENKTPQQEKADTTAPLKLDLNKIHFTNIHINYKDDVVGNDAGLFLGDLALKVNKFDLANQHYILENLHLANTQLQYYQNKPLTVLQQIADESIDESEQERGGKLPLIETGDLKIDSVGVIYDDRLSDTKAVVALNSTNIKELLINLTTGQYKAALLSLQNSNIAFDYRPTPSNEKVKEVIVDSLQDNSFGLQLNKILLANNTLVFNDLSQPRIEKKLDYNHLNISNFSLSGDEIVYDTATIKASLKSGSLKDHSGFTLQNLQGDFVFDNKQLSLDNFLLKTPQTHIDNSTLLEFSHRDDLSKHPEKVKLQVNLRQSVLSLKDAAYFTDAIPANYAHQSLFANTVVNGYLNNFTIDQLQLNGLNHTKVAVKGTVKGLPDPKKLYVDLKLDQLASSKGDILAFVPKSSMPQSIDLPNRFALNGTIKGGMNDIQTQLKLNSDFGGASINGFVRNLQGNAVYNASVKLAQFNVGKLLKKQDQVGTITATAHVKGSGLEPKKINATFEAQVANAFFNQYNYTNIALKGFYRNQLIDATVQSIDSNLNLNGTASLNMNGRYPAIKADMDIQRVNLQALNFYSSPLTIAAKANIDFTTADPDYLNGNAYITGLQVYNGNDLIHVDTLAVRSEASATHNLLQLQSTIANATVAGKYQLTNIAQAFINQVNQYYAIGNTKTIPPQYARFSVQVPQSNLLQSFVPGIKDFTGANLDGVIDTNGDSLLLNAGISKVVYNDFDVRDFSLNINNTSRDSGLQYRLGIAAVESPSIQLYNTALNGAAANNNLGVNLFLRDKSNRDKYTIGGNFNVQDNTYRFSLAPDKLLLNYEKWQVANDNLIQYGKAGINVRNFAISNSGQSFNINSVSATANAPINIAFQNFSLATLTRLAEQDTALVQGILNGQATLSNITSGLTFTSDLAVNNLSVLNSPFGNLTIKANSNQNNIYEAFITLKGVHDLDLTGTYNGTLENGITAKLNINRIDIKSLEGLSRGEIRNGNGYINGVLDISGSIKQPSILGNIAFNNAGFNIRQLNSYFSFPNEKINFTNQGIAFNNFTIRDSLNQAITINGLLRTTNYQDFGFDLRARADNFRVLNATARDNPLFYGKAFVTFNTAVKGNIAAPEVTGTFNINKGTDFYFVIPESNPGVISQDGIVEFIDVSQPKTALKPLNVDSLTTSAIKGLDVNADISIDKEAKITVVVDPETEDALNVIGQADLSMQMDRSGKISLTGRYDLEDGGYQLTVGGIVKKEFKIQKGSSLIWTGGPTDAIADITAVYNIETSAMDLVSNEITDLSSSRQTMYRQKLPFKVLLKIKGELLKPQISFQIEMPEEAQNALEGTVYTKVRQINNDENELNKQVLALLTLNRFVSNNPFQSLAGGASINTMARQSVSRLLTDQLNSLAADLIKGVDISFDLNSGEDYSTGTVRNRTDLNVQFSKRFLNDRLTVSVGSDFNLEGAGAQNANGNNIGGNVNIEYMLSKDGRYRIRAYRRNKNEGIIEGQIVETGLGFALVVEYNKFRQIFNSFKKAGERKGRRNEK